MSQASLLLKKVCDGFNSTELARLTASIVITLCDSVLQFQKRVKNTHPEQNVNAIQQKEAKSPACYKFGGAHYDEGLLDGALPVVYRHKTQQKDKSLVIMYTNLSEKDVIISPNQLIAHGSMIFENKTKPVVNVVKKGVKDPVVTERIWAELKLNENKILQENVNVKNMVYSMINDNQDIFTTEDCKVDKTTWETFKIELIPNARPVNQRMRPIPPNLKENFTHAT